MVGIWKQVVHPVRIHLPIQQVTPKKTLLCFLTALEERGYLISLKPIVCVVRMVLNDIPKVSPNYRCGVVLVRMAATAF